MCNTRRWNAVQCQCDSSEMVDSIAWSLLLKWEFVRQGGVRLDWIWQREVNSDFTSFVRGWGGGKSPINCTLALLRTPSLTLSFKPRNSRLPVQPFVTSKKNSVNFYEQSDCWLYQSSVAAVVFKSRKSHGRFFGLFSKVGYHFFSSAIF